MNRLLLTLALIAATITSSAQLGTLTGIVYDSASNKPMAYVDVTVGPALGTSTDENGVYTLQIDPGAYEVTFSFVGYKEVVKKVFVSADQELLMNVMLPALPFTIEQITVSGSKFEKNLSEETVSMSVIKPQFIENTNSIRIDYAIGRMPGINMIGGQANIRGGSGFSYGAGSRVLLLMDDLPILTADAGYPNWDLIPTEAIEQVEIIKGASSALYGSAAMNGVINIRTAYAKSNPETFVSAYTGFHENPADKDIYIQYDPLNGKVRTDQNGDTIYGGKNWWGNRTPFLTGINVMHRQKAGQWDIIGSGALFKQDGYIYGEYNAKGRLGLKLRYRFKNVKGLSAGISNQYQYGKSGTFFYWMGNDNRAYLPTPGTNTTNNIERLVIDPFVEYYDRNGNRFKLLSRYYMANSINDTEQSTLSDLYYSEFQYQRKFDSIDMVITSGIVVQPSHVDAELYRDEDSNTIFRTLNSGIYVQIDKRFFNRLNLSVGGRYELNKIGTGPGFDTVKVESRPVFRAGLNYQVAQATFIRTSFGQGYRFPSIAEAYVRTDLGGIKIYPNDTLHSEHGWTAEFGIRQGMKLCKTWYAFADVAVFMQEYYDMMEFSFGYNGLFGFQSINIGDTRIKGLEISLVGGGKIKGAETSLIAGYTYIDPQFQEFTTFQMNNSSDTNNVLKYRFRHSAKLDVETNIKGVIIGAGGFYNSHMEAVDALFDFFIPGLTEWRNEHDKGNLVWNARAGYQMKKGPQILLICDNLANKEYTIRPAVLEPPRTWTVKVSQSIK